MSESVLDHLIDSLRKAAIYNRHDLAAPSVVLWTDGERLWSKVIPLLRDAMPELLVLAPEIADERTGPSTWLRYQLARSDWQETPIVYLPGIARHAFRGAAGFPEAARHLFALQYQGQFWSQVNGKDWTPSAFLSSAGGRARPGPRPGPRHPGGGERATGPGAARKPREPGRADAWRRRTSTGWRRAMRSVCCWSGSPAATASTPTGPPSAGPDSRPCARRPSGWIRTRTASSPPSISWSSAAESGTRSGSATGRRTRRSLGCARRWIWSQPKDLLDATNDRMPATNRQQEDALRSGLSGLAGCGEGRGLKELRRLCEQHVPRADSLWARPGRGPAGTGGGAPEGARGGHRHRPGRHDWDALATGYVEHGWLVDAAAWRAYAAVRDAPDVDAGDGRAAGRSTCPGSRRWRSRYRGGRRATRRRRRTTAPAVRAFAGDRAGVRGRSALRPGPGAGTSAARTRALRWSLATRWSALPTVTATAKPAWRPAGGRA